MKMMKWCVRVEQCRLFLYICQCPCANTCLMSVSVCLCECVCVLVSFCFCVNPTYSECFWHSSFLLCSMRNASGLMAADLAHAQGFQECAQILANAQNLQQNTPQSHNRAFLNGMSQNGGHILPTTQGRSFLNGVPNRKRSFDGNEANPLKRARPNGRSFCCFVYSLKRSMLISLNAKSFFC